VPIQVISDKGEEMSYQDRIAPLTSYDPRHVEGWMRLSFGTLDHLGAAEFESEVCLANACISEAGTQESEALAVSYGL
jgi:hypothetical protein